MTKKLNITESYQNVDFDILSELLLPNSKKHHAYIIRDYYNKDICKKIITGFHKTIGLTKGGNRFDHVPVNQIGATQFTKKTIDYFVECKETKYLIDNVINNIDDNETIENFLHEKSIRDFFNQKNIVFRQSIYEKEYCNSFTVRKWNNNKEGLSLFPHEDLSQLNFAKLDNYEIGNVQKVIACNLCVSNTINGGELILWDFVPTIDIKEELGVQNNGYPYPLEMLEGYDCIEIKINAGDLYFINANLVHAVKETGIGERITLGKFMGYSSDNEIVCWT